MTETGGGRRTSDGGRQTSDVETQDSGQILKTPRIVIPKRGLFARGICCFAAGSKQIPCR